MHYKKYFRKWRVRVVRWMTSSTKSKKHSMFVYFVLQCVHAGFGSLCTFFFRRDTLTYAHVCFQFRRIRQNPDSENPSKSPSHPPVSASRTVPTTGRNKSSSKVAPGPDTRAGNVARSVSTRRREEARIGGVSMAEMNPTKACSARPLVHTNCRGGA